MKSVIYSSGIMIFLFLTNGFANVAMENSNEYSVNTLVVNESCKMSIQIDGVVHYIRLDAQNYLTQCESLEEATIFELEVVEPDLNKYKIRVNGGSYLRLDEEDDVKADATIGEAEVFTVVNDQFRDESGVELRYDGGKGKVRPSHDTAKNVVRKIGA